MHLKRPVHLLHGRQLIPQFCDSRERHLKLRFQIHITIKCRHNLRELQEEKPTYYIDTQKISNPVNPSILPSYRLLPLVVNLRRPTVCTRHVTFVPVVCPCCLLIFIYSKPASSLCMFPVQEPRTGSNHRRTSISTCRIVSRC